MLPEGEAAVSVAARLNVEAGEGARFAPAMIASGVFAGVFARDWAAARADRRWSSRSGLRERIPTWAAATPSRRADLRRSRWTGCCRRHRLTG